MQVAAANSRQGSSALLAQLQKAHDELLDSTHEMERVTAQAHSDPLEYGTARYQISRLSLARRFLWRTIFTHLSTRATPSDAETLQTLSKADMQLLSHTSSHVIRWTNAAVQADWTGYGDASRQMRKQMLDAIANEKRLLYPLLSRYA